MELTDSQINSYVETKLKLPPGKRKEHLKQVDHLIERFEAKVRETNGLSVIKFLKTGSLRKGTVLRPRDGYGVDADIAVFIKVDSTQFDLTQLHEKIRELLRAVYPSKQNEDFSIQPRTLGITFRESDLAVDLVPVLPDHQDPDFGWQPSSKNLPPVRTSISKQLDFIRNRRERYANLSAVVRLLKQWRNHKELDDSFRSFTIELVLSHLLDKHGPHRTIENTLLNFFLFIAQDELSTKISFPENGIVRQWPSDRVVVLDPVNADNNVTSKITRDECSEIVKCATEAWEKLSAARNSSFLGETTDHWKSTFGRSFEITKS